MAGVADFIANLIGAGTTAQPNPYYGAQLLTPADHPSIKTNVWVDANGQPITDPTHISALTAQPSLANQPWDNVGFFKGFGTTGREIKAANMAAEEYPGQQAQQLAAQERQMAGDSGQNMTDLIANAKRIHDLNQTSPQLFPSLSAVDASGNSVSPQLFGQGAQVLSDATHGVYDANAASARAIADRTTASSPAAANPFISNAAIIGAQADSAVAPYTGYNRIFQAMYGDPAAQSKQFTLDSNLGIENGGRYIMHRDPATGKMSVISNPLPNMQNQLLAGALGGQGGSVGAKYGLPPRQPTSSPFDVPQVIGLTGGQQTQLAPFTPPPKQDNPAPSSILPISGTNYGHDTDGNVYYMPTGQFVPPENYKDTALGKAIQHTISAHKAIQSKIKSDQLPHNIYNEYPKSYQLGTWQNTLNPLMLGAGLEYKAGRLIGQAWNGAKNLYQ